MSRCPVSSPVEPLTSQSCHHLTSGSVCACMCACCCQQCDAACVSEWASACLCAFVRAINLNHQRCCLDEWESIYGWVCVWKEKSASQRVYQLTVYVIRENIISFNTACGGWLRADDCDDNNSNCGVVLVVVAVEIIDWIIHSSPVWVFYRDKTKAATRRWHSSVFPAGFVWKKHKNFFSPGVIIVFMSIMFILA